LLKYQITLMELGEEGQGSILDTIVDALTNPMRWLASVASLDGVLGNAEAWAQAGARIFGAVTSSIQRFGGMVAFLLREVATVAQQSRGVFSGAAAGLYTAALAITSAGRAAFAALAAEEGLSTEERYNFTRIASDLGDAECTIANGFNTGRYFASFDDLFGASNCSSTGGGRSWSTFAEQQTSPFAAMFPPAPSRIAITQSAAAAITSLQGDPLLLAGNPERVASLMDEATSGITINP
jgi:hypothetical protein